MAASVSGSSKPSIAIIQALESKLKSAIGKEQFEQLCKERITLNFKFVASPFTYATEVEEQAQFQALMQEFHAESLPSQISLIFEKVFSLHFKTRDPKAFEEERKRYVANMQKQFIASLEEQVSKLTCWNAVKERDLEKLKNLRKSGTCWGYKLLETAKHMVEDPFASILERARSIAIMNWIDTEQDLEEMQKLEEQLEEMGVKGDELKMMHYSHAGMAQRFVDDSISYIFLPFYGAIQMEWRPSRNNAILEECFDEALEKYGKIGMPDWINQKNIRLKQIRELQIEGLNLLIDKLGALNKETKAV